MLFVDGENFTIRAQKWAEAKGVRLKEGFYYRRDVFIWIPGVSANDALVNIPDAYLKVEESSIRSYYYTSVVGDENTLLKVKQALNEIGFSPEVFKKNKRNQKAKGVDIALAKDFLSNAYNNNCDVMVLIAGDGDYVPLIEEVKRYGKVVYLFFFKEKGFGLSDELKLASDRSFECGNLFQENWENFVAEEE